MTDISSAYEPERKCKHYEECERAAIPGSDCCAWCGEHDRKIADWIRDRINEFVSSGDERKAYAAGWTDREIYGILKGWPAPTYGLCDYVHKGKLVAINASVAAIDRFGIVRIIRRDSLGQPQAGW